MEWQHLVRAEDGAELEPIRYYLQQLLASEPASRERDVCLRNILDMVTTSSAFPVDAYYSAGEVEQNAPIFHWILRAGCDVEVIKLFWPKDIDRKILFQRDFEQMLPIDLVCQFGSPQAIKEFVHKMKQDMTQEDLAKQLGNAPPDELQYVLDTSLHRSFLPCHQALRNPKCRQSGVGADTLRFLVANAVPLTDQVWRLAVLLAVKSGQPEPELRLLGEFMPSELQMGDFNMDLDADEYGEHQHPITLPEARLLANAYRACSGAFRCIFDRLLTITGGLGWEVDAFAYFVGTASHFGKIQEIEIDARFPAHLKQELGAPLNALRTFLENNRGVKEVLINLCDDDPSSWRPWMRAAWMGLLKTHQQTPIECIRLYPEVPLFYCEFYVSTRDRNNTPCHFTVDICGMTWLDDPLPTAIAAHSNDFFLDGLHLSAADDVDDTDQLQRTAKIVALLEQYPTLRKLSVREYDLDSAAIFACAKRHASLQYLELQGTKDPQKTLDAALDMMQANLVLEDLEPWGSIDPRIRYFANLNRFGRAKAISATEVTVVLELVEAVKQHDLDYLDSFNVLFGLLMVKPDLWLAPVVGPH